MRSAPTRPVVTAFLAALVAAAGCGVSDNMSNSATPDDTGSGGSGTPTDTPSRPSAPAGAAGTGGTGGAGGGSNAPGGAGGTSQTTRDAGAPMAAADAAAAPAPSGMVPSGGPIAAGVPREKTIVFIHIGHSNMAGRANAPAELRPYFGCCNTNPADYMGRLWSFHGMNMTTGKPPLTWRPAREPLSPDSMTGSNAGPGMALLRAAEAIAEPDVHFISTGHGHSGEAGGLCAGFRRNGILYPIAMTPAMALKGRVTFGGIFTMLGVTERHADAATQAGFLDCMKNLAREMREDLGDMNIPFIAGDWDWGPGDTDPEALATQKVIAPQLKMIPTAIPRAGLTSVDGFKWAPGQPGAYWMDSHHFTLIGHQEWGTRAIKVLKDNGWAPWAK